MMNEKSYNYGLAFLRMRFVIRHNIEKVFEFRRNL